MSLATWQSLSEQLLGTMLTAVANLITAVNTNNLPAKILVRG